MSQLFSIVMVIIIMLLLLIASQYKEIKVKPHTPCMDNKMGGFKTVIINRDTNTITYICRRL